MITPTVRYIPASMHTARQTPLNIPQWVLMPVMTPKTPWEMYQ